MKKFALTSLVLITIFVGSSLAASCAQGETTRTITTTAIGPKETVTITQTTTLTTGILQPTSRPTSQPPSTLQPTMIASDLATFGETLFNRSCTYPDCHAKWGEGGKDEFPVEILGQFVNAGRLFNFVSNIMHLAVSIYQEDVLTQDDYLQILALMLIQNDIIESSDTVVINDLASITIDIEPDE
ncbi:MAG: hypothetical protein JSV74_05915 [Dehalococcoidia bacterium]|nr:MAG: hypothetical protein JSV74_05915 [Dehalococcoidia bacterium]